MDYPTRSKLVFSCIIAALLVGSVSLMAGWRLLYDSVLNEAGNRVRQDLNVARVIYDDRITAIRLSLEATGLGADIAAAMESRDPAVLAPRLERLSRRLDLDFAGVMAADGTLVWRKAENNAATPPVQGNMPIADAARRQGRTVSGTVVLDRHMLEAESPGLAKKARIPIRPAMKGNAVPVADETAGLAIASAVPVMAKGKMTGILYGGMLLNRDRSIVDKINGTVFRNEVYQGHNVGTATIFFRDLRIATTVLGTDNRRAIGTPASREVTQRVLTEGERWTDRAFVVNDWYITAYEPITDIARQRVGMLYVGVLEAKYRDVRQKSLWVFAMITFAGVIIAMALVRRDQQHREENEKRLIRSEKQASIGKLAAGVAHEINNPLTAVLTFTHLILRRKDMPEEVRKDLETIAVQTERVRKIVKGLLDFSRQGRLVRHPLNMGSLLEECVHLMENQAQACGVALSWQSRGGLPMLKLDRDQIQSVMVNMILNALDATPPGGKIEILLKPAERNHRKGVEIALKDTGTGIAPEHMDKLFDPFFTTKEPGKGTGLGLAVSAGIIDRHGGKIRVESKPGKGSVFTIWLPCRGPWPSRPAKAGRHGRPENA